MELQEGMFRDLIENHTLLEFQSFATPVELLSRYNIAQTQVALFDAVEVIVQMREDFKSIVRYAKLARLMHRIQRTSDGYRIALDGPASLLQNTSRYGVSMAKFLPGLLSCRGWSLSASIRKPKWGRLRLLLDAECGLNSSVVAPSEFDSSVEEKFYERWKNADTLGWSIERETEILSQGQSVFFPDFVFRHQDGRVAMMEIIGFWTPEYLEHKRKSLSLFPKDNLFFAIHQSIDSPSLQIEERRVLRYKTSISVETVLRTLREAMK
jgi:predicted nuclease of restriction endonuclease-like RecB superfamily